MIETKYLEISAFAAFVSATVAAISAVYVILNNARIAHRKRQKLSDAIRYNIQESIDSLASILDKENMDPLEKKIAKDLNYMPYAPWSISDDLTYVQAVEALEILNGGDEEEKLFMSYFYNHKKLRALVECLTLDFVRAFPTERKLLWLKSFKHYGNKTLTCAKKIQEKNLFPKR